MWTWGANGYGPLGDNTSLPRSSPVQTVTFGTNWKQVSCGYRNTAAVKQDGTLWTWGSNNNGQLGTNGASNAHMSSPVQTVAGGTTWKMVSVGNGYSNAPANHVAAIKTDGTLWVWGYNGNGQLGDNTRTSRSSPVQTVTFGTNWMQVSAGYYHTAAVKNDGTLWTWGLGTSGQLGDNSISSKSSPVQTIASGNTWLQAACGNTYTAAIKTDGTLWTWGLGTSGQLGDSTSISKSSPVQTITYGTNWKQVSCGSVHTVATKTDGTLWTWGADTNGQLGDNTIVAKSSPVQTITSGYSWKQAVAGFSLTMAIQNEADVNLLDQTLPSGATGSTGSTGATGSAGTASGALTASQLGDYLSTSTRLWAFGLGTSGQLGDNTILSKSSPIQTTAFGTNWKQISVSNHNLTTTVVKSDGSLWSWGLGTTGQLGDNTILSKSSPVQTVAGGTTWLQSASGFAHTVAVKNDGTLWVWGDNATYGQLGDNTVAPKSSPVQTTAFGTNWKNVASGSYHCAATKTDGTLWTWGRNSSGQLGDNTIVHRSSPVQTTAFGSNWVQISCGYYYTAAVKNDGTLWTWGINTSGQLGENTASPRSSPIQTVAYGTNWRQVSAGNSMTACIKTDGTLWTWGQGTNGTLGDNTAVSKSSPVQTVTFDTTWKQVSAGNGHMIATKTDNTMWSWGLGTSGQLGDNTIVTKSSPVQTVTYGYKWKQAYAGNTTTYAIQTEADINLLDQLAASSGITITDDTTTNSTRYVTFTSATSGSISTENVSSTKLTFNPSTGDLTVGGNVTANSDLNLKEDIVTIPDALQKVRDMRGVSFSWKENGRKSIGVVAQEVEKVLPELVNETDGVKSVAYGNIIGLLIEAIKEQQIQIDELKRRL